MKTILIGILMVIFGFLWTACHKEDAPKFNIKVEEINTKCLTKNYNLVKEAEISLDIGNYAFTPVRSDTTVYIRYRLTKNEVKLLGFDFDLSLKTTHSFMYGQGPGEWVNFEEFVGFEDAILMIDRAQDRITWFDSQMNIVNTIRPRLGTHCASIHSEMVKKGNGLFGFYYMTAVSCSGKKRGYYASKAFSVFGGEISPRRMACKLYYQAFRMHQKEQAPIYEVGPKLYFAQAGDSLYVVDAETYTLTRMNLSGVPVRSIRLKTERPEFSKKTLQKWEKGFRGNKKDPHAGMWNPTWWYPSPLMPVAGVVVLGRGLAVITCENYDPDNKPEMLKADYFDLELNPLGVVHFPYFKNWNNPFAWVSSMVRRIFRWHSGRLFYIDSDDEERITLSRWRLE